MKLRKQRGFTLVECVVAMVVLFVIGIGTIASLVYSRSSLELERQRMTALGYCRQYLESASSLALMPAERTKTLSNLALGGNLDAAVQVWFFPVNNNGTVNWTPLAPTAKAPNGQPILCRVTISWSPAGRWSRSDANRETVSIQSLIRAGVGNS